MKQGENIWKVEKGCCPEKNGFRVRKYASLFRSTLIVGKCQTRTPGCASNFPKYVWRSGSSSTAEIGPLDECFGRTTKLSWSEVYARKRYTKPFEETHVCVWTRTIMRSWLFDWRYYPRYNMPPTVRLRLCGHCNEQCEEDGILMSLLAWSGGRYHCCKVARWSELVCTGSRFISRSILYNHTVTRIVQKNIQ